MPFKLPYIYIAATFKTSKEANDELQEGRSSRKKRLRFRYGLKREAAKPCQVGGLDVGTLLGAGWSGSGIPNRWPSGSTPDASISSFLN